MVTNENAFLDESGNIIIKTFFSCVKPEKRTLRDHHHTECEISLVVSGKGKYSVHGIEYDFCEGDMFLFGSNESHCIVEISEELVLMNIYYEPRIFWEAPENIELLNIFFNRKKNFSNKIFSSDTFLKNTLTELEVEMSEKKHCYKVRVKYLLFSALVHILRSYDFTKADDSAVKSFSAVSKLKNAVLYIDKNLDKKLTLKEISDIACMTPNYFSTLFKKFNGITLWEYITIKRVEKAIEMIKSTDMTKLEIAEKCGLSGSSNFYKAFAKVTGKKPNDFN